VPRPRRDVAPAEVKRLGRIRTAAVKARERAETEKRANLRAGAPDAATDLLGALAWAAATCDPGDPLVADLVGEALDRRLQWREIAVCFGIDPDDGRAIENVAQTFRRRR